MISLEFLLTCLVVVLMPGTGVLFTVTTALFQGRRASLYAACGCTLGILPSLLASILGLAILFHTSALLFQAVKYLGVAYLLFLAWSMLRAGGPLALPSPSSPQAGLAILLKGFLLNILNPKLTLFFLAFLPQFLPPAAAHPTANMLVLGGVFMAMTWVIFLLYGLLATQVRQQVLHSPHLTTLVQRLCAASFAALGLKLALTEQR